MISCKCRTCPMGKRVKFNIIDYETRSKADLKKVGAYNYARHPSTQILCVAWRCAERENLKTTPIKTWSPALDKNPPVDLVFALADPYVRNVAHNALFEQVITRFVLTRYLDTGLYNNQMLWNIPISKWDCTAARAATHALPRKLEDACFVLRLPIQKDMEGNRLMKKMSKPRKPTKNNPAEWHNSKEDLLKVMAYCKTDVAAETELFLRLPDLDPTERKVWELDQKINQRGFLVDRDLVDKVLVMIEDEIRGLNAETKKITKGAIYSTTQTAKTLEWIRSQGRDIPNLTAKVVSDALSADLPDNVARILKIRQSVSRTSTKKYEAFKNRMGDDDRVRDILMYHGASTGRWSGTGVQPQNFPRGKIKNTDQAAEILKTGDLELVRMIYGDPMQAFSSCLRSAIIAPPGRKLFCADFASIEVRVLFWLAGHSDGLKAYIENRDLYREMAAIIYNHDHIENVTKDEREVGKRAVLGCGYGMGAVKFEATCKQFGMEVDEEIARTAVYAYRNTHWPIKKMWTNLEQAAIRAVQSVNQGSPKRVTVNKITWFVKDQFLFAQLPSGRRLSYFKPELKWDEHPIHGRFEKLYYWGVNSTTKQWERSSTYGGHLTENVVQATARDLMVHGMLTIEPTKRYDLLLSSHDELLAECDIDNGRVSEFESLMATLPPWAKDCPVKAAGWSGGRYKK